MKNFTHNKLKWISLVCLTTQNAVLALSMRYARTRTGVDMFYEGTAVLMAEVLKLVICSALVFRDENQDWCRFKSVIYETVVVNKVDTLKVCVPSLIYLLQNNLLYVAAEHLDVATYQITYQLKILTTALFAILILKRTILKTQWVSLIILVVGVVLVQLSDSKEASSSGGREQNRVKGFSAAIASCFFSGLAGIYFEKILKGADISVWMRNIQLSLLALPLGVTVAFLKHWQGIATHGFFYGYDAYVLYLICLNACGGLLVAAVVKYSDNILKGFACSIAIVLTCIMAVFLFGFQISGQFVIGTTCVIISVFLYGYRPPPLSPDPTLKSSATKTLI